MACDFAHMKKEKKNHKQTNIASSLALSKWEKHDAYLYVILVFNVSFC